MSTENTQPKLLPTAMYDVSPFCYCGLYVPKQVMEKLAKQCHKHDIAIREILTSHKTELFVSHWTMATDKSRENAAYVRFVLSTDGADEIESRIKLFKSKQPERREEIYIVDKYEDAKAIAEINLEKITLTLTEKENEH